MVRVFVSVVAQTNRSSSDSLSAFFPSVQVLYGDLTNAERLYEVFYGLWQKYHSLPESWNYGQKSVSYGGYPLRPELIESTYWLYRVSLCQY
jgi:mannosidase alpha-like ER degradation enhancer 1